MINGAAGIRRMLVVAMVLDVSYWLAWFLKPTLVTDIYTEAFVHYENAFPLGHAVVLAWVVTSYLALGSSRPAVALLWLPCAAGAKGYITAVDVLYNLQNQLYESHAAYVALRLTINVLTTGFAVIALRWTWARRKELVGSVISRDEIPQHLAPRAAVADKSRRSVA